ncbi:MAG TPA: hypothetical protein VE988_02665 [Gemmataceae bacterium]|nr:hypothetical protein [Gemmataceae bacterium]
MFLYTTCPSCNVGYDLAALFQGKKIRCKKCARAFAVVATPRPRGRAAPMPFARPQAALESLPLAEVVKAPPVDFNRPIVKRGARPPRQPAAPPPSSSSGSGWFTKGGGTALVVILMVVVRGCIALTRNQAPPPQKPIFVPPPQQQWQPPKFEIPPPPQFNPNPPGGVNPWDKDDGKNGNPNPGVVPIFPKKKSKGPIGVLPKATNSVPKTDNLDRTRPPPTADEPRLDTGKKD